MRHFYVTMSRIRFSALALSDLNVVTRHCYGMDTWSFRHCLERWPNQPYRRIHPCHFIYNVITFTTCKSLISKQVTAAWQQRWDRSVCARTTYEMVPSVGSKSFFPKNRCIAISYARLLLNDTTLKAHQYHMGLADTKVCECNMGVEDVHHFFFQCTRVRGWVSGDYW